MGSRYPDFIPDSEWNTQGGEDFISDNEWPEEEGFLDSLKGIPKSFLGNFAGGWKGFVDYLKGAGTTLSELPGGTADLRKRLGTPTDNPALEGLGAASEWLGKQEEAQKEGAATGFLGGAAAMAGQTPGVMAKFGLQMLGTKGMGLIPKAAQVASAEMLGQLGGGATPEEAAKESLTSGGMIGAFGLAGKIAAPITGKLARGLTHTGLTWGLGTGIGKLSGQPLPEAAGSGLAMALMAGYGEIKTNKKLASVKADLAKNFPDMPPEELGKVVEAWRTGKQPEAIAILSRYTPKPPETKPVEPTPVEVKEEVAAPVTEPVAPVDKLAKPTKQKFWEGMPATRLVDARGRVAPAKSGLLIDTPAEVAQREADAADALAAEQFRASQQPQENLGLAPEESARLRAAAGGKNLMTERVIGAEERLTPEEEMLDRLTRRKMGLSLRDVQQQIYDRLFGAKPGEPPAATPPPAAPPAVPPPAPPAKIPMPKGLKKGKKAAAPPPVEPPAPPPEPPPAPPTEPVVPPAEPAAELTQVVIPTRPDLGVAQVIDNTDPGLVTIQIKNGATLKVGRKAVAPAPPPEPVVETPPPSAPPAAAAKAKEPWEMSLGEYGSSRGQSGMDPRGVREYLTKEHQRILEKQLIKDPSSVPDEAIEQHIFQIPDAEKSGILDAEWERRVAARNARPITPSPAPAAEVPPTSTRGTPPPEESQALGATHPLGVAIGALFGTRQLPDTVAGLNPPDAAMEARQRAAEKLPVPRLRDRVMQAVRGTYDAFRHTYRGIDPKRSPEFTLIQDALRQHENVPNTAAMGAVHLLTNVKMKLGGPNRERVMSRVLILRDMLRNIEKGTDKPNEDGTYNLPFTDVAVSKKQVAQQLSYFEGILRHPDNAPIRDALAQLIRQRRALLREAVAIGALPPEVRGTEDAYWHRQVISEWVKKRGGPVAARGRDVRTHTDPFQMARTGSGKDYNTDFLESEFEWTTQLIKKIETRRTLAKLDASANIARTLPRDKKGRVQAKDVPEGYTLYDPHFLTLTPEEQALSGVIPGEDAVIGKGGVPKPKPWVIRKELAAVLDQWGTPRGGGMDRAVRKAVGAWKQWILLNPGQVIRYNANNMSGDLDITLALDPRILKQVPQATRDLIRLHMGHQMNRAQQLEAEQLTRLGVISSGWAATEVQDVRDAGALMRLTAKGDRPGRSWRQAVGSVREATAARENLLRLAAYRHYLGLIKAGKRPFGASSATQMENLYGELGKRVTAEDIAAKLSREGLGDYGNISRAGKYIREHLIPFYSWMEINTPRYFRLLRNIGPEARAEGLANGGKAALRVSAAAALKAGKLAVFATAFTALVNLWNRSQFPEEDKKVNRDGRKLMLILGRNEDGSIKTIRVEGALSDALSWIGLGTAVQATDAIMSGEKTLMEQAEDTAWAPVDRLINSALPGAKTAFEVASKRKFFPSIRKSSPIRDRAEHVASFLGVAKLYRYITGKPRPPMSSNLFEALLTYRIDPGEAAWQMTKENVAKWQERNDRIRGSGGEPTAKQNALYYYKKAMQWGDKKAADKWLREYAKLGGTRAGMQKSIEMGAPLAGLAARDQAAFWASLSEEDKQLAIEAQEWYRNWAAGQSTMPSGGD